MATTVNHPPQEKLEAFLVGGLIEAEFESVGVHHDQCQECVERASVLQMGDPLTLLLSAAAKNDRLDNDPSKCIDTVISGRAHQDTDALGHTFDGPLEDKDEIPRSLKHHPRYSLIRGLGRGGMGTVWLAEHLLLNRLVAIKTIHSEFLAKPGAAERMRREMKAVAKLSHPNVVAALDAETSSEASFLVTEYIEGNTLAEILASGPMEPAEACRAIRDAAHGLAHAHAAGLIHRDVKPANLIRSTSGQIKLLDLGLVAPLHGESDLTGENMVMGTPDYVSPEQALDPRSADVRSDIYSLGCTSYHLLSGKPPFSGQSTLGKLDDHRWREPQRPTNVSDALWQVLSKMLAKSPQDRFSSAEAVAIAIEPFCNPERIEVAQKTTKVPPLSTKRPFSHWTWIGLALVGCLASVCGVAIYRIQTDYGELVITAFDDDVQVVIEKQGKVVAIVDKKSDEKLELRSGQYHLRLKPENSLLKLDIEQITLRRGDTKIASIVKTDRSAPAAPGGPVPSIDPWYGVADFKIELDLNREQLASKIKLLEEGWRPARITYVRESEPPRFNITLVHSESTFPFEVHTDLNGSGEPSQINFTKMLGQKWSMREVCSYPNGQALARHHLWIKDQLEWIDYRGARANVLSKLDEWRRDGFWPVQVYLDQKELGPGIVDRAYGVLVARATTSKWQIFFELSESELNEKLASARKTGLRPTILSEMGYSSEANYCLCLAPNPEGLEWSYEFQPTRAAFEAVASSLRLKKLRPLAVYSRQVGSDQHYRSIWAPMESSATVASVAELNPDPSHSEGPRLANAKTIIDDGVWMVHMRPSRDGKKLFLSRANGTAEIWELATGNRTVALSHSHRTISDNEISTVQPFDKEQKLLTNQRSAVVAWDWATSKELFQIPMVGQERVMFSAISDDDSLIAICFGSGIVRVWDIASRQFIKEIEGDAIQASHLLWLPGGHRLAMSQYKQFQVIDIDSGDVLLSNRSDTQFLEIDSHQPTSRLGVIQRNGMVTTYDLATLVQKSQFLTRRDIEWAQYRFRFMPDGRVVTGGGGLADISDPTTGKLLYSLIGVNGLLTGVAAFPDGKTVATCTQQGQLKLWEVPPMEQAKE